VSSGQIFSRGYLGMTQRSLIVVRVLPGSPAAAAQIRPGDQILSANGIADSATAECRIEIRNTEVGEPLALQLIARDGRMRQVVLVGAPPPPNEIFFRFALAAAGFLSLLIGFLIAFQRPERLTLVFFAICYGIAFFMREPPIIHDRAIKLSYEVLYNLFTLLLPAFAVHFFLLFPTGAAPRRRWLEVLIYVPAALIALMLQEPILISAPSRTAAINYESLHRDVTTLYFVIYTALAIALFVRSFLRTRDGRERARLKAALIGTVLGLAPVVLAIVLSILFPAAAPALRFAVLSLCLIPAAFGYAAFRHRVFDTEILVKRSVLYSLLTAILIAIYFGLVIGLGSLLHRLTGAQNPLLSVGSVIVIALIAAPARARLQRFVDRLFYRERYDARVTLRSFSHDLARMLELEGIATLLVERVVEVLGLESGMLLLRAGRDAPFTIYHATSRSLRASLDPGRGATGVTANIAALFADRARPLRLDGGGDLDRLAALSADERARLTAERIAVAVPLWGREHLLGVLLLGTPRSGEPIAQEDIDLLVTLGEQAAIAIENALLHRSEIERERMAQELRVARGIQAHLVPNSEPASETVEFAGTTVASHEIGGDFYDYVPLAEQRIGIAIGDVAGKGVPAALLLAGLQSTFRNEAERGRSPAQVTATLNHRIHAVGERDRFVCFFYGLLDLANRQLVYTNAGLDPPILVRASGRVERLRVGGPVLGVMPGAAFQEAKVSLATGDTLVLYTDGLVEPVEVRSGFGETDLIDFLVAHRGEPPARLRQLTLDRLVELAGEISLDDTTLIVARAR
jgi:sigma-B regulation protein RsbU (phosphoserine phosphatase)